MLFHSEEFNVWRIWRVSPFSVQDKVHIPGAIYLSVKFDSRCYTEEGCDELIMSSSSDFLQDLHNFSGSPQKWADFEIPGEEKQKYLFCAFLFSKCVRVFEVVTSILLLCGCLSGDTLYYRFMSDMSNTEWGYKFTVTGGHRGRFQTGKFEQMHTSNTFVQTHLIVPW